MRTMAKALAIVVALSLFCVAPQRAKAQVAVSFQVFYDDLGPYGQWVDDPDYGYVWVPSVGAGFTPYATAGHWVYTDYGWTWVSDYSWGWAPFHYGRWDYDDYYGWLWVPGDEWAPAWVGWRECDGYYGWAPLGPGASIGFGFRDIPASRWVFVRDRYITSDHITNYYEPRTRNDAYISRSTVVGGTVNHGGANYYAGPRREDAERATGNRITPVTVASASKPGARVSGNQLSIYHPAVSRSAVAANNAKPAPAHVVAYNKGTQRNVGTHNANRITTPNRTTAPNRTVSPANNRTAPNRTVAPSRPTAPVNRSAPNRAPVNRPNNMNNNRVQPNVHPNVRPARPAPQRVSPPPQPAHEMRMPQQPSQPRGNMSPAMPHQAIRPPQGNQRGR